MLLQWSDSGTCLGSCVRCEKFSFGSGCPTVAKDREREKERDRRELVGVSYHGN